MNAARGGADEQRMMEQSGHRSNRGRAPGYTGGKDLQRAPRRPGRSVINGGRLAAEQSEDITPVGLANCNSGNLPYPMISDPAVLPIRVQRHSLKLLWKGFCQEAWLFWSSDLLSAGR